MIQMITNPLIATVIHYYNLYIKNVPKSNKNLKQSVTTAVSSKKCFSHLEHNKDVHRKTGRSIILYCYLLVFLPTSFVPGL